MIGFRFLAMLCVSLFVGLAEYKQAHGQYNKSQGVVRSQAAPCFPCQQQPYNVAPYATYQPYPASAPPSQPFAVNRPSNNPHKLALFLNGSVKSHAVHQWFTRNAELAQLRRFCEFTIYQPGDTLYQARYASLVPVNSMPAVLWVHQVSGDYDGKQALQVAAIGGGNISSDAQLVHDLRKDYALFLDINKATAAQSGAMYQALPPQAAEFWNHFAAPTLILNQAPEMAPTLILNQAPDVASPPCNPNDPNCPYRTPAPVAPPTLQPDAPVDVQPFPPEPVPRDGVSQQTLLAIAVIAGLSFFLIAAVVITLVAILRR